jgi:hypothetical protein
MTNRQALSLSAVLAATVLTGGAAILGLNHTSASPAPPPTTLVQAQPAPSPTWLQEGD